MNRDLDPEGPSNLFDHPDDEFAKATHSFFGRWLWIILGAVILYGFLSGNFKGFTE